jgi:hypothetical protein
MDHIFEHDGQPIPDLSQAVPSGGSGTASGQGAMDVDDDEAEDLRAALKLSKGDNAGEGASAGGGGDAARVCAPTLMHVVPELITA